MFWSLVGMMLQNLNWSTSELLGDMTEELAEGRFCRPPSPPINPPRPSSHHSFQQINSQAANISFPVLFFINSLSFFSLPSFIILFLVLCDFYISAFLHFWVLIYADWEGSWKRLVSCYMDEEDNFFLGPKQDLLKRGIIARDYSLSVQCFLEYFVSYNIRKVGSVCEHESNSNLCRLWRRSCPRGRWSATSWRTSSTRPPGPGGSRWRGSRLR